MLAFMGLLLCVFVHRNARMVEEIRRIFEVVLAFADNVRIKKRLSETKISRKAHFTKVTEVMESRQM